MMAASRRATGFCASTTPPCRGRRLVSAPMVPESGARGRLKYASKRKGDAMTGRAGLCVEEGGSGAPALLLLHGLGGNAAVWETLRPVVEARWPGRWLAPDLPGHGRSPHAPPYSLGAHAAAVARLFDPGEKIVVLGHSMGGAVGITLASGWFAVEVAQVIAFGVKLLWREEEIAKARALARAPARRFATCAEVV